MSFPRSYHPCRCLHRNIQQQQQRYKCSYAAQLPVSIPDVTSSDVLLNHVPEQDIASTLRTSCEDSSELEVKHYSDMPGPRGLPLIGNAIKYSKFGPYKFEKILENRLTYMRKYGKVYREKLGAMEMVHIFDPTDIATMFRLEGEHPSRGTIANLELTYLKRNNKLVGFAFRDGPEWARQRGYIQRLMMHPTAATRYLNWQIPVAQDFVEYLNNHRNSDGIIPDLYQELFKYTMESIGAVCFGDRIGAFNDQTGDASKLSAAISETFFCFRNCMFAVPWYQYFKTPMYRRFENAANEMRQIMGKHIDKIATKLNSSCSAAISSSSSLRSSLESPTSSSSSKVTRGCPFGGVFEPDIEVEDRSVFELLVMDDRVSRDLAENLIMALFRTGIDSTGNSLAFFLYNLANNPDKQQLVYEEICQVLPGGKGPTAQSFKDMPYLRASLRESFRLHFPVFGGSGRVMPEDTVFSGYKVPRGVFIFANIAAMSRMREYFPRPEEYHPERWLRDSRASLSSTWTRDAGFLSLPFSHGLRACPGKRYAEQGLYLAAIAVLQKFRLVYDDPEPVGMIHMPFTTPDKPLNIKFIPRHS